VSENATDWLLDDEAWEAESMPSDAIQPQPQLVDEEPDEPEEIEGEDEEDDHSQEETEEEPEDDDEEEGEEDGVEDGDEEDALVVAQFDTDDPDVRAFLSQYGGDPLKALQAAAHLRRAFDRQGTDLGHVRAQLGELQEQVQRGRMLGGAIPLSQDQHEWAEAAANSGAPGAYVDQAIQAGEFDLARAVCSYWGRESPYEAARAGMAVDQEEGRRSQVQQAPVEARTEDIVDALKTNVPGFREWESQMVRVFENLGAGHHLVQESRSNNVDVAMRALMNIFEIAQASSASVQEQKQEIRKRVRKESASAKAQAAVTSGANSTSSPKETSRQVEILPGLTLEALDTEFAANS